MTGFWKACFSLFLELTGSTWPAPTQPPMHIVCAGCMVVWFSEPSYSQAAHGLSPGGFVTRALCWAPVTGKLVIQVKTDSGIQARRGPFTLLGSTRLAVILHSLAVTLLRLVSTQRRDQDLRIIEPLSFILSWALSPRRLDAQIRQLSFPSDFSCGCLRTEGVSAAQCLSSCL